MGRKSPWPRRANTLRSLRSTIQWYMASSLHLHNESQSARLTFKKQAMSAFFDFACSIARTVDVAGEWWTLLILRDLFAGMSAYDELQRDLGIASNVLAARLQSLRGNGLVERSADPADAR